LKDPGVDGRIILRWMFRKWYVGGLDKGVRDKWRTLVNVVMNIQNL
jgi:hypothetical protein